MAYSALSALSSDSTLNAGDTVSNTEHNTHRTNYRALINNLLTEGTAAETHRASSSQPTDKTQGIIWMDTTAVSRAIPKFYYDGSASIDSFATLAATQTFSAVNTFSNTTDASSTTTGGVIISGGLGVAKKLYVGSTSNFTGLATFAGGLIAIAASLTEPVAWSNQTGGNYPASGTTKGVIGDHFNGDRSVDLWNCDTAATASFTFRQKTGASAAYNTLLQAVSATDAFGVASQMFTNLYTNTAGTGLWQFAGGAARTLAGVGVDVAQGYSDGSGIISASASNAYTVTIKGGSLNANKRKIRITIMAAGTVSATVGSTFGGTTTGSSVTVSGSIFTISFLVSYVTATTVNWIIRTDLGSTFTLRVGTNQSVTSLASDTTFVLLADGTHNITIFDVLVEQLG